MTPQEEFVDRISRGPAALLLGQAHLALGRGGDPLVDVLAKKVEGDPATGFELLFTGEGDDHLGDWLENQSRSLAVSEHLDVIAGYEWIAVWSSAVDPLWAPTFDRPWREIQLVLSEDFHPSDPRNRRRLHCTYLFGAVSRSDAVERAPTSALELIRRRGVANALARRLISTLGPTGVLAVDGYEPGDWFRLEDLAGVVSQLQPGQCHLFGASVAMQAEPTVSALIEEGLLVPHDDHLAQVLQAGAQAGRFHLEDSSGSRKLDRLVSFAGEVHSTPRDLWVELTNSARVLDEDLLAPATALSPDANYSAFREFLGATEGAVSWDGVARNFVFRREFEAELENAVRAAITRNRIDDPPIVVHGATGTGKSMAMAAVAYRIASEREHPVLFVDRRAPDNVRDAIDRFCIWAEDDGAALSIVFWDGMLEMAEYEQHGRILEGRGRQIVLIGSAYKAPTPSFAGRLEMIGAPDLLSKREVGDLSAFLGRFGSGLKSLTQAGASSDRSFLVSMYRLLPSTRSALRTGVVRELTRAERIMVARAGEEAEEEYEPQTALARALHDAGLLPEMAVDSGLAERSPVEDFSLVQDMTALVMVPAQYGLDVPLEVVLRAVGREGYMRLPELLREIDLVRWVEDGVGNFLLGARSPLEARLIVQSRLGTTAVEVAFVKRLLLETRPGADSSGRQPEIDFAVSLVRALGAQGPSGNRYRDSYADMAQALAELRVEGGVENPRLILQEANLRREVLRWVREKPAADRSMTHDAEEEVSAISAVLEEVAQEFPAGRNDHLRVSLEVERASGLAALSRAAESDSSRVALYRQARAAAHEARTVGESNFYPLDVLAWASRDVLQDDLLEPTERLEVTAEVLSAFEVFDVDGADVSQIERFHRRRQEFGDLVDDVRIADDAFDALLEAGSAAGVYLRARQLASLDEWREEDRQPDMASVESALAFLERYAAVAEEDPRCLNLAFDLWWFTKTGGRPFDEERACLPLPTQDWAELRDRCASLLITGESYRQVSLMYLRGLAEFHLGAITDALATFSEVERQSDEIRGRRRIARSYLASDTSGAPRLFGGTINWVSGDMRRGEVYIDDLRQRVRFIPREFGSRDLRRGSSLGDFHIGFNYLGIIADPVGFYRRGRRP